MLDRGALSSTPSTEDEERFQNTLRPRTLAEFIGQEGEKRKLDIAIRAAKLRREPLEHVLLSGPPGLPSPACHWKKEAPPPCPRPPERGRGAGGAQQ